jgi:ATPase subunit of ABC transporter with duplicated ATPase domains
LDRVVERIVELDEGELTEYPGDYSYYREEKEKRELGNEGIGGQLQTEQKIGHTWRDEV